MELVQLVMITVYLLAALTIATLGVKTILFFKFEKAWDSVGFFYFAKPVLKMTCLKELKVWRQRQNYLTKVFLFLLLMLTMITIFKAIIF